MKLPTKKINRGALALTILLVALALMTAFAVTGLVVFAAMAFAAIPVFGFALSEERSSQRSVRVSAAAFKPFVRDGAENLSIAQAQEIMASS
jgi:archaellum biogenesis protein FlaJ (TadC family)